MKNFILALALVLCLSVCASAASKRYAQPTFAFFQFTPCGPTCSYYDIKVYSDSGQCLKALWDLEKTEPDIAAKSFCAEAWR